MKSRVFAALAGFVIGISGHSDEHCLMPASRAMPWAWALLPTVRDSFSNTDERIVAVMNATISGRAILGFGRRLNSLARSQDV
jgi:hypothetical protein